MLRCTNQLIVPENRVQTFAAILATSVAKYSRLMGADEEVMRAQLKAHQRVLLDPKIDKRRGRIVKIKGRRSVSWWRYRA